MIKYWWVWPNGKVAEADLDPDPYPNPSLYIRYFDIFLLSRNSMYQTVYCTVVML